MSRAGRLIAATLLLAAAYAPVAGAADAPVPWDGVNPFVCQLQNAGFGPTGPDPGADPYCVEFDKRRQNVDQLGVVDFLANEPARVAAATDKCFYFQSDHWRGSIVQADASTKTYEWDGHYFFDKAKSEGGAWVTNFNVNGQSGDPRDLPGFPAEWRPFFSKGTGGVRTRNSIPGDPSCAARAAREPGRIYRGAGGAGSGSRCPVPAGGLGRDRLGPVRIGDSEATVRRLLGPPLLIKRGFLRWCLSDGARYIVGELGDRSGDLGPASDERAAMVLSTSRTYRYGRVRPGARLPRRVRGLRRRFRYGNVTVWSRRHSPVLVGVRHGRVRFVAVRERRNLKGRRPLATYLKRAG